MPRRTRRDGSPDPSAMSLLEHLEELRWRLLWSLAAVVAGGLAGFFFAPPILEALLRPLGQAVFLTPAEGFMTHVKVGLVVGGVAASPVVVYQVLAFVLPGLDAGERRVLLGLLAPAALLFAAGVAFAYTLVLPGIFRFFLGYAGPRLAPQISVAAYVSFVLGLVVPFGLVFQMPLAAWGLARLGFITPAGLRRARRYAVLAIFVAAGFLTPPDVMSQLFMAAPMLVLYELAVRVAAHGARAHARARRSALG